MSVGFEAGRFEYKYLVTEATAQAMRACVTGHLAPDAFMVPGEIFGYHVHSLYLDSPCYSLYRESTEGIKNRHKLRMRFYDDKESSPVFLEIKSRVTATIRKLRIGVTKQAAMRLLWGIPLSPSDMLSRDDKSMQAADEFVTRLSRIRGNPAAMVSYRREAYVSLHAEAVRITFDRQLVGSPFDPERGLVPAESGVPVNHDIVVAEFKYVGSAPSWMRSMIRDFRLNRVSYPKYVHCLDAVRPMHPASFATVGRLA